MLVASLGLSACASNFKAAYDMIQAVGSPSPYRFEQFEMNPNLQYLEAHTVGAQAMMVLGYVATPKQQPPVQTWYDSQRELLRLQNGFLVSVTGVNNAISTTEYTWAAPNQQAVQLPTSKTYSQPDQQIFNKTVALRFQAVPESSVNTGNSVLRKRLLEAAQQGRQPLVWFQEVPLPNSEIPYSLHAFASNGSPVYGSQCLTPSVCVEWLHRTNPATQP
ncbi:YjbF family lipoprotein [Limnobacter alexandrii]|uniref:YjbF family lipoprotein n=1 Tax=Limnobacter alexandrii TaxID=2570352 RepID=UPI00110992D4|nr:YjbF family lipoprotein [Limnobacter alexandrii]